MSLLLLDRIEDTNIVNLASNDLKTLVPIF